MINKAAALAYESHKDFAPRVVAHGKGALADAIIGRAKKYNIEIFQNKELVDALLGYEIDQSISPELYEGVARVFVWLDKVKKEAELS